MARRGLPPRHWARHRDHAARGAAVARVDGGRLDVGAFRRDFVAKHEPCVVVGAVDLDARPDGGVAWGDLADDAYLAARCGDRHVLVRGAYVAGGDHEAGRVFASTATARCSLRSVLAERAGTRRGAAAAAPRFYAAKLPLAEALPEVDDDLKAILRKAQDRGAPEVVDRLASCFGAPHPKGAHAYLAPDGAATGTHLDPSENLLVVLRGAKRLRLFPHRCARNLDPANAPVFTVAGLEPHPFSDAFLRDPGLRGDCLDVTVEAGDLLYIPAGWWHAVLSVGASTILNFWSAIHPDKATAPDEAAADPRGGA